ncbi:MAG: polyprenyl synthetase family protein [Thermodesulfobacteriota bacterium]|nr:polyprenyl synthetase family protein [Thermodesulfobacteriota bacterium]
MEASICTSSTVSEVNSYAKDLSRYKDHFEKIDEELVSILSSRVDLIENIGGHTLSGHGKRLRPLFFVLSCQLCDYKGEGTHRLSTVFEYIHTASLLHDDVLDNAEVRRNKPSANRLWGNHAAVLVGDFLSSRSFSIALDSNSLPFLRTLIETATTMAEGQVLELVHTDDWNITKEEYMEVVTAKTAVLISAACACGSIISGTEVALEKSLADFGLNAGIAFQLVDDLLDYISSEEVLGKPVCKDVREGKITLPLIYTLQELEDSEKRRLEDLFKNQQATEEDYRDLIELVRSNGAVDRIQYEAQSYSSRAASCLSLFPDSAHKRNLLELNQYIIERRY